MPDLDLGPNDYRVRRARRHRWPSLDTKTRLAALAIAIVCLGYIFARRDELASASLFGVTALFAFGAGMVLAVMLGDRH